MLVLRGQQWVKAARAELYRRRRFLRCGRHISHQTCLNPGPIDSSYYQLSAEGWNSTVGWKLAELQLISWLELKTYSKLWRSLDRHVESQCWMLNRRLRLQWGKPSRRSWALQGTWTGSSRDGIRNTAPDCLSLPKLAHHFWPHKNLSPQSSYGGDQNKWGNNMV